MEVEKPVVELTNPSLQFCQRCSAEKNGECKIAWLRKVYDQKPNTYLASEEGIDFTNIPADCPNGYVSPEPEDF